MASTDLGVLLRWAADGGAVRSRPRPQHGEHRRGSAQYCGDSGRIRFPQVGHPKQAQRLHSRLPGLTNPNPARAPPPGRSTQQMPQVFQWLSYLTFQKYGCELLIVTEFEGLDFTCSRFARWRRPPLRARGERSCVCSSCIFKNMQTFIFYYASCCYLLDIQSSRSDWKVFPRVSVLPDVSNNLPGACFITHGDQIIDVGYPGALSRYTLDFLLLYSFLPALLVLGMISYKIRDRLVRHWRCGTTLALAQGVKLGAKIKV